MSDPVEPIPAATLVLLRARAAAAPELLMLERASHLAFAPGALVFPGGRIEAEDRAMAAASAPALDPADAAGRIAAIRETIEEAGVAAGLSPAPSADVVAALRIGLKDGVPFADLLARHGLTLALDAIVPFARWLPKNASRVFDTRFYVAAAPHGDGGGADGGEAVCAIWTTIDAVLADADAGRHRVIFPTRRNLEWIAAHGDVDAVRAAATRYPRRIVTPWIEERDGVPCLCIPDDLGYPVCFEPTSSVLNA
jgi:8-oxo-dGTP pyrophosphatase MutT (NUDIX family)